MTLTEAPQFGQSASISTPSEPMTPVGQLFRAYRTAALHSPPSAAIRQNACVLAFEGVSKSLRRAPYVWLAATVLWLLLMNSGLVRIAKSPGHGSNALALVGLAFGTIGVALWILLQTRLRRDIPLPTFIVARWLLATVPFAFAWVTVADGAEQWVIAFGFPVSVLLLVIAAVRTRRDRADAPDLDTP